VTITITTDAPASYKLREIVVQDGDTFDPSLQHVEDAVPPIAIRPTQIHHHTVPTGDPPIDPSTFGLFAIALSPDPTGTTSHSVPVDGTPLLSYEIASTRGRRKTTLPASVSAHETVYVWASSDNNFPD
jgi:hypothetical protein